MSETGDNFYIECPNVVILCIDRCCEERLEGRLCHAYKTGPIPFWELEQAIMEMEKLFDTLNFPMRGNRERGFLKDMGRRRDRKKDFPKETGRCRDGKRELSGKTESRLDNRERLMKVMDDTELKKQHGELGTFIVRVKYRQHNSWQGQVVWAEKNIKQNFRSVLELIKMIDSVVGTDQDARRMLPETED